MSSGDAVFELDTDLLPLCTGMFVEDLRALLAHANRDDISFVLLKTFGLEAASLGVGVYSVELLPTFCK